MKHHMTNSHAYRNTTQGWELLELIVIFSQFPYLSTNVISNVDGVMSIFDDVIV